jgi:hypothetical protein
MNESCGLRRHWNFLTHTGTHCDSSESTQTLPLTLKINTGGGGWGDGALEISEITTCCVFGGEKWLGIATWMLQGSEKDFGDVLFCWPLSNQWCSGFANFCEFLLNYSAGGHLVQTLGLEFCSKCENSSLSFFLA